MGLRVLSDLLGTLQNTWRFARATLSAAGLTAARTYTLPDVSGTVFTSGNLLNIGTTAASARTALELGSAATTNAGAYVANNSVGSNSIGMSWQGSGNIRATVDVTNFTLWSSGNSAQVIAGTVTGQIARWNQTTGRYEAFDLLGASNTWSAMQLYRVGAINTQQVPFTVGWSGGSQRWAHVLESTAGYALYCYDSAGGNATVRLSMENAVGGSALFIGSSSLTYGGNTVWHSGNFSPSSYGPLSVANTWTAKQTFGKNNPALSAGAYADGNIEVTTYDGSFPRIGFHRAGINAVALYYSGENAQGPIMGLRNNANADFTLFHSGNLPATSITWTADCRSGKA